MYQRQLKLYKNVDNVIQFQWKNSDQKRVNVSGWIITFNMISDEEGTLAVTKDNGVIGGLTVVDALNGLVTVSITKHDLIDLRQPYYNYALTVTDPISGVEQVVYIDENYESRGEILLRDGPYPEFQPSTVVDLPSSSNTSITSSAITADNNSMQQAAHHTAQYYFDQNIGFTGNLSIWGTLDPLALVYNNSPSLSWGYLGSTLYTAQTVTDYYNFDGVYTAVRFIVAPTSGNVNPSPVTKILYRSF